MACGLIAALEDCLGFTCIYFVARADESDKWCVLNMKFDANQPGVNMNKNWHKECNHCNGYGSSLKDAWDVNVCTVCGGSGLVDRQLNISECPKCGNEMFKPFVALSRLNGVEICPPCGTAEGLESITKEMRLLNGGA